MNGLYLWLLVTSVFQSAGLSSISGEGFIKTLGGLAGGGAIIEEQGFPLHEKRFGKEGGRDSVWFSSEGWRLLLVVVQAPSLI